MKIRELFENNDKTILSFEVFPPKTEDKYEGVLSAAKKISEIHPSFISVTYGDNDKQDKTEQVAVPPAPSDSIVVEEVKPQEVIAPTKNTKK